MVLNLLKSKISDSSASVGAGFCENSSYFSFGKEGITKLLLEKLVEYGIPALFKIIVIAFTASQFRSIKSDKKNSTDFDSKAKNPAADLYRDLYSGDDEEDGGGLMGLVSDLLDKGLSDDDGNDDDNNNRGVPGKQYVTITNINQKLDSYEYSVIAATQSNAKAAANYRAKKFDRAMQLGLIGAGKSQSLSAHAKTKLLQLEKEFLSQGSTLLENINMIQAQLTKDVIDDKMETMGMTSAFELDPPVQKDNGVNTEEKNTPPTKAEAKKIAKAKKAMKAKMSKQLTELNKEQKDLMDLELEFIGDIVEILGSERAAGIRTALLGDIVVRGSGGLLTKIQERPLTTILNSLDSSATINNEENSSSANATTESSASKRLFVTYFPGDMLASQVKELREEVTSIVRCAKPGDEALVILESGGGTVTGYGLASAQLLRFKEHGMKLTVAVEQVAASGGYMMCCVADKIVGSPFAVFGSIGVVCQIPNVYDRLKTEGVEFQTVTAGEFKRTVTPFKKVTEEDLKKTKADIEDIFDLFRDFVKENRPSLNIEDVATGETWFGTDALKKGLCDEIKTADDIILEYAKLGWQIYEVRYTPPKEIDLASKFGVKESSFGGRIAGLIRSSIGWLVQAVVSETQSGLVGKEDSVEKRYMARYDQARNFRMQS